MSEKAVSISCKLTTPERQERKKAILSEVKKIVVTRTETETSVRYKFKDTDETIDLIAKFIQTEKLCCSFFTFNLIVGEVDGFVFLELSGPDGTKDFIANEIEF